MNNGWIKIARNITEKPWYGVPNDVCLFMHLIMDANFTTSYYRGVEVKSGQLIRSHEKLAVETGLTINQVRTSMKHLISTGEITQVFTHVGNLITLENYGILDECDDTDHAAYHTEHRERITNESRTDHGIIRKERKDKKEKNTYGVFKNVRLSEKEFEQLTEQFGEEERDSWIRKVDEYCERTGKTYRNYALTITSWAKKDGEKAAGTNSEKDGVVDYEEWARQYQ